MIRSEILHINYTYLGLKLTKAFKMPLTLPDATLT